MARGSIKDQVAIIGMGCTAFGEKWNYGPPDLVIEAAQEAFLDAGVDRSAIEAVWIGNAGLAGSAGIAAQALKLPHLPVTRVENWCATGSDTFRNACFGVAAGMYDIVLALGFEKLKDSGVGGLATGGGMAGVKQWGSMAPGDFALPAARYFDKYGATRETLAKIAVKNHHNGSLNEKAHFRNEITVEQALNAPMISWPFGLFDCCGTSDGAAAAIICRAEIARSFRDDPIYVGGLGLAMSPAKPHFQPGFDYLSWPATVHAGKQAYEQMGISDPFKEVDLANVHDCFTLTELLIYEDLGFCGRGEAKDCIDSGVFSLEGDLPVNTDGGLKCFGHPIGASGLRMLYEAYKQLQGKAGPRQVKNAEIALAHNLGGPPQVSAVTIIHN